MCSRSLFIQMSTCSALLGFLGPPTLLVWQTSPFCASDGKVYLVMHRGRKPCIMQSFVSGLSCAAGHVPMLQNVKLPFVFVWFLIVVQQFDEWLCSISVSSFSFCVLLWLLFFIYLSPFSKKAAETNGSLWPFVSDSVRSMNKKHKRRKKRSEKCLALWVERILC